ncbi:MAG: hypothetical protein CMG64_02855 [Candidatus Marinimicrobia bacterium]|nr:hypothetical protein [Candidatus Neomarinimicrobiota bacterium]
MMVVHLDGNTILFLACHLIKENRMKKQFIKIIILSSISFLFSEMKIGYVNANEVLADFDDARQVQVEIEKEEKRLQAELESKIMKRDSLAMDYEKRMMILDDENKRLLENEIMGIQSEIENFQMKYFGPQGELYRLNNELMAPITELLFKAIEMVAEEREYDFILNLLPEVVLYSLESHDVTDLVQKKLQRLATETSED